MCVLIFCTTFVYNISHIRKTERDTIKVNIGLHVKYRPFVSDFHENLNFLDRLTKNLKYQIS